MSEPRYSISVAAELAGLHPQTLRMYESRGLVRPRRTPGGTRRYSDDDLVRLRKIVALTGELGMSLAGAERVLELEDTVNRMSRQIGELERLLVEAARRAEQDVAQVHRRYRRDLILYQPAKHPERWTSQS